MRTRLALLVVAVAVAGCGPTPPQAPLSVAKKIDHATGGISYACGQAYEVNAFGGDPKAIAALEAQVQADVTKLVEVYRRSQTWIYQSETVRKIVKDAASTLESCGLHGAERKLARETG